MDKVTLKDISIQHRMNVKTEQNGRLVKLTSPDWTSCFDATILTVKIFKKQVYVLLQNGELCFINMSSGARSQSSLFFGQLAFFDLSDSGKLITVTIRGDLTVRQMPDMKVIYQCSVLPLISTSGSKLENVWLGANGKTLFVRIGALGIFTWNEEHSSWHIYRKNVSFVYGALPDNDDIRSLMTDNGSLAPITSMDQNQYQATGECVTAHLEEKVNLSFQLGNGKLYRKLLLQYVRHLVTVNDERRLREICDSLLGPVHQTSSDWSDVLLGTLSKGTSIE